ncbi:MAG: ATP-binding cassette domain-containing protein [Nitriliruptorales bacterium]|nr:ATP-binding cassette domain-containing protein [Nitriliruptorales bacterium]
MTDSVVVTAEGLTFGYDPGHDLIRDLTFSCFGGAVTGLLGRSGAGKSTLLYLLGLMLRPTAGRVTVRGRDTTRLSDRERSRMRAEDLGFVFQDAALDNSRTVLDNIVEAALFAGQRYRTATREARRLMQQFDVEVPARRRPGEISGGQAQRIALCRALITRPSVVLADEPTGNLDEETGAVVVSALRSAAYDDGAVVIVASHDPTIHAACDSLLRL